MDIVRQLEAIKSPRELIAVVESIKDPDILVTKFKPKKMKNKKLKGHYYIVYSKATNESIIVPRKVKP